VGHSESSSATLSSNVPSCKSLSSCHASFSDGELAQNVREGVTHRILYLSEQLRVEKARRDENTMSYLKLVSRADQQQAPHIRKAFEKVNQRTSATIAQIERKLYRCHRQLKSLEMDCSPTCSVLEVDKSLDSCGQPHVRASYSESPKPRGKDGPSGVPAVARSPTLESHLSGSQQGIISESKHVAQQRKLLLKTAKEELAEVKEVHAGLQRSHQSFKERYLADLQGVLEALCEKKCRQSLMAEQVNNHLQRHLDEICHLKQHLACTEEKMAYLSYERAKEVWETMETFKSRISKLETLQQATQVEMVAHLRRCPQNFLFKFISLLLTLATILLVLVSTMCSFPLPLVNSRLRICTALMLIGLGATVWQKRHTTPIVDWQAWVPLRWRPASKPPSDG
uniref:Testis expressed 28 n=1 Tax=Jaculus jaculus TaxID=51337 RepID=A0A8C5L490_JACJA